MFDFLKNTPYLYTVALALFIIWLNIVTFYLLIAAINGYKLSKSSIRKDGFENSFEHLTKYNNVSGLLFEKFDALLNATVAIFAFSTIFMGAYTTNVILYLAVCYGDTLFRVLPQCLFLLLIVCYRAKGATVVHGKLRSSLSSFTANSRTRGCEVDRPKVSETSNSSIANSRTKVSEVDKTKDSETSRTKSSETDKTKDNKAITNKGHAKSYIIYGFNSNNILPLILHGLLAIAVLLLDVVYIAALYYQFLAV